MKDGEYLAFTTKYSGIASRLITHSSIIANGRMFSTSFAQWDTGATGTCVSHNVVQQLGLKQCGFANVNTPSGNATMPLFIVDVVLPNNVTVKDVRVMESEIGKQNIDMLIGMDIIALGDFSVTTDRSDSIIRTYFSFRIPSVNPVDFVKEWNDLKAAETKET